MGPSLPTSAPWLASGCCAFSSLSQSGRLVHAKCLLFPKHLVTPRFLYAKPTLLKFPQAPPPHQTRGWLVVACRPPAWVASCRLAGISSVRQKLVSCTRNVYFFKLLQNLLSRAGETLTFDTCSRRCPGWPLAGWLDGRISEAIVN